MSNQMMTQQAYEPFLLPDMVQGGFTDEDLADDMEGVTPSFQRIKIPGGGVTQFEMPSDNPDQPNYEQRLVGVIVYTHLSNAYWAGEKSEDDDKDNPPTCQAVTGKYGFGTPGGICDTCKLNAFGSGKDSKGKACKNMRALYFLRSGDMMPMILNLPPTSLKPYNDFANSAFLYRRRPIYASVVEITITRKTAGGQNYGVAVFKRLRDFEGEELARISAYVKSFREQAKIGIEQRSEQIKAEAEGLVEREELPMADLPSTEGHFALSGAPLIYGDVEKLPA